MVDKNKPVVPEVGSPEWQGYTLRELYYRRDVNSVRQALLLEQMTGTYNEIRHQEEKSSLFGFVSRFDSLMSVAQYGFMGLTVFSKVKSFFRKMKRR